jgi:uncharacterized membrane protein YgaE (UPF0421/DUF939 family)
MTKVMAQLISIQRKQEIIVSLELKIQESVEKISLYNDIYTYVDDMEPTAAPELHRLFPPLYQGSPPKTGQLVSYYF